MIDNVKLKREFELGKLSKEDKIFVFDPKILKLSNNNFVISWTYLDKSKSEYEPEFDASFALFNSSGFLISSEQILNDRKSNDFTLVELAQIDENNFIVIWQNNVNTYSLEYKFFNIFSGKNIENNNKIDDFLLDLVNANSHELYVKVSEAYEEKFIIVWESRANCKKEPFDKNFIDTENSVDPQVFPQLDLYEYNSDFYSEAIEDEYQLNDIYSDLETSSKQSDSLKLKSDSNNKVFEQNTKEINEISSKVIDLDVGAFSKELNFNFVCVNSIYGKQFSSNLESSGEIFKVNDFEKGKKRISDIKQVFNGKFFIVWEEYFQSTSSHDSYTVVKGKFYDGLSLKSNNEIEIAQLTNTLISYPRIHLVNEKLFAVSYTSGQKDKFFVQRMKSYSFDEEDFSLEMILGNSHFRYINAKSVNIDKNKIMFIFNSKNELDNDLIISKIYSTSNNELSFISKNTILNARNITMLDSVYSEGSLKVAWTNASEELLPGTGTYISLFDLDFFGIS